MVVAVTASLLPVVLLEGTRERRVLFCDTRQLQPRHRGHHVRVLDCRAAERTELEMKVAAAAVGSPSPSLRSRRRPPPKKAPSWRGSLTG